MKSIKVKAFSCYIVYSILITLLTCFIYKVCDFWDITMLAPLPGIILGIVCLIFSIKSENK